MNNKLISKENMRIPLSLSVAVLLILSTVITVIPAAFAAASTTTVSPLTVTAKAATALTFTIANPGASTASYSQVQIRVSARWSLITPEAVTTTGLGGTPSVSISGIGPYVVVVSGIALAPGATGTVKIAGMVADVGLTGSSYTDPFTVFSLDATSGALLVADANNGGASLLEAITVTAGTATFLDAGMMPSAAYISTTLAVNSTLHVHVNNTAGANVGSNTTIIVIGRDVNNNAIIGHALMNTNQTDGNWSNLMKLNNVAPTAGQLNFKSITEVLIRGGTWGDDFYVVDWNTETVRVRGITTRDTVSGSLIAGQSIDVVAVATDNTGKGASGVSVAFESDKTGSAFSSASVSTTVQGTARNIYTTSTSQGTNNIKTTATGLLFSPLTFAITTVWGPAATLSISASPNSITAVGGSSTISLSIKDANGNTRKVAGTVLTFGTSAGVLSAITATTSSAGTASITLSATPTTVAGSVATITSTGAGLAGQTTVSFTSGPVAGVTITVSSTSMNIQGSVTITATVKDANNNPITGATVAFTQTVMSGLLTYAPSLSPTSAITGASGQVTTTLTASIEAGTLTVTGTSGGYSATTAVITINGGSATTLTGTATPSVIAADGVSTSVITWTLKDGFGNVVKPATAVPVTITTSAGTFTGTGTSTASDSIQTITGMTTGVTLKSTTTVGKITVTANGGGIIGTLSITFAGQATDFKLSAKPSTVQIGTASTVTLQLIDPFGNNALAGTAAPIVNTLSATAGTAVIAAPMNASGTLGTFTFNAPATVPPGGISTLTIQITITTNDAIPFQVQHQLTIPISGAPNSLVLTADPTSLPADGIAVGKVNARLVDANGVTIISGSGTTIGFSTTAGTLLTTSVVTDLTTGISSAYIKAPATAGLGTLTAVGGGVSGTLGLNFTTPGTAYVETLTTPVIKDTSGNVVAAPRVVLLGYGVRRWLYRELTLNMSQDR